ncbi:uncharacterized protein LOC131669214 [Phymastichus coffea]|uniref:uncharacterized protein LOC131669214 n=1 Tax=Phymastichus coffea TaxID=108790 RepID=UPI00273B729B|nr:uncharacterized protein LOC131669214 [Phymastichus coffea]
MVLNNIENVDMILIDKLTENLPNESVIVYFDLELSGLGEDDDILQIAVKCGEDSLNVYLTPTKNILSAASEVTGLTNIGNKLYLHNKKLTTIDAQEGLRELQKFLMKLERRCIFIANNVSFDSRRLIKTIINNNMLSDFSIISGFSDLLKLFRKVLPDSKGTGMFKVRTLSNEFLSGENVNKLHNAYFDVVNLEKFVKVIASE